MANTEYPISFSFQMLSWISESTAIIIYQSLFGCCQTGVVHIWFTLSQPLKTSGDMHSLKKCGNQHFWASSWAFAARNASVSPTRNFEPLKSANLFPPEFELLNLAGGFPAKRTLLVTAISRRQKTSHPKKPAIKLPTMELPKLTKSLFSQRQPRRWRVGWPQRWSLTSVSFWHGEQ